MEEKLIQNYVNENYETLKKMMKKEYRKMERNEFDEDIFHETLIKCMDIFKNKEILDENEFKAYLTTSFKINVIRNKQYHVNSMKTNDNIEDLDNIIDMKYNIDFNIILENVKTKFGEENYNKFIDWLENKTIQEINKDYNCNNSRYLIDKIRNFINENYKDEMK